MATKNFNGVLDAPIAGDFFDGRIRFTHISTTGTVLSGSRSYETLVVGGMYDFDLFYGEIVIESKINTGGWYNHGSVIVSSSTTATTLPALLLATTPATPELVQQLEAILSDAESAAADSKASAVRAEAAAVSSESAVGLTSGGMVVNRLDDNGNLNVMVKIPAFTNKMVNDALGTNWTPEEALHPAFIGAGGVNRTHFEMAMYCASSDGSGNPVSAPYKAPYTPVSWDSAKAKCQSMGSDWDLCGNSQWAAVAIWCLMNGYQPGGNTFYGQYHAESWQSGIRQDSGLPGDASGTASILSGSGPLAWRHSNSEIGIADLIGNVWEWQDGLKIIEGQLLVATEQSQDEANWSPQAAYLDSGNKLNSSRTALASISVTWGALGIDASYLENQLLQQLLIEPAIGTDSAMGHLYYNNAGDRFPRRGGSWSRTSQAGLGSLNLDSVRTNATVGISFRPCYFGV